MHMHMHISHSVAPDPVTNLMATDVTERTITITWMNGFDGNSPIVGARIDYFEAGGTLRTVMVAGNSPTTYTLMGLTPFASHTVTVFLLNVMGAHFHPLYH